MSYTSNLTKIKPASLSLENLPKYIKFVKKHGETPVQYIERMSKEEKSALIKADVKNFLSKEKALGSRRKSQILKSEKINPEQDMKDVTYFNTDLQKYITTKVPSNINIIKKKDRLPISFDFDIPEFDYSDLYDVTPTSGVYIKKRVSKKRSVKKSGGGKRRISKKRSMKKRSVKRISKKRSMKKRSVKRISKKHSSGAKRRISKKHSSGAKRRISKKHSSGAKRRISKKHSSGVKKRSVKRISKKHSSGAKKRSFDFDILHDIYIDPYDIYIDPYDIDIDLYDINLTNGGSIAKKRSSVSKKRSVKRRSVKRRSVKRRSVKRRSVKRRSVKRRSVKKSGGAKKRISKKRNSGAKKRISK